MDSLDVVVIKKGIEELEELYKQKEVIDDSNLNILSMPMKIRMKDEVLGEYIIDKKTYINILELIWEHHDNRIEYLKDEIIKKL